MMQSPQVTVIQMKLNELQNNFICLYIATNLAYKLW